MSRVGKNFVRVPEVVALTLEAAHLVVSGPFGTQRVDWDTRHVQVSCEDGDKIYVKAVSGKRRGREILALASRRLWGTTRANIQNAVRGVAESFHRRLRIQGVGYRARVEGEKLVLALGFSHEIVLDIPSDLKISLDGEDRAVLVVSGPDKQRVGQMASEIRSYRPPEPYKGKGVRYAEEMVYRKEGKKK